MRGGFTSPTILITNEMNFAMMMKDLCQYTFKTMQQELGQDQPLDPRPLWQQTLSATSTFCRTMVDNGFLTEEQMLHAVERYRLGCTRNGGVIFWQIDEHETSYDGKVMWYRTDGHRDRERHPTWVTSLMKQKYGCQELTITFSRCLFGQHLLKEVSSQGNASPAVAIVEAEKTAVVLSELLPDYLWVATGGLSMLTVERLAALKGRRVMLFPDTDLKGEAYNTWLRVAEEASNLFHQQFLVSDLLERHATEEQKQRKIDLVEFILINN